MKVNGTISEIKPLRSFNKHWKKGFITVDVHYPPTIQQESAFFYFGFDRPLNRLRIKKVMHQSCVCDIATGFLIPDAKLIWHFATIDKADTYNPLNVRLLNAGITGKYDNWILLANEANDINIELDYFTGSTNNYMFLHVFSYLPISFVGLELIGHFTVIFDYQ